MSIKSHFAKFALVVGVRLLPEKKCINKNKRNFIKRHKRNYFYVKTLEIESGLRKSEVDLEGERLVVDIEV